MLFIERNGLLSFAAATPSALFHADTKFIYIQLKGQRDREHFSNMSKGNKKWFRYSDIAEHCQKYNAILGSSVADACVLVDVTQHIQRNDESSTLYSYPSSITDHYRTVNKLSPNDVRETFFNALIKQTDTDIILTIKHDDIKTLLKEFHIIRY